MRTVHQGAAPALDARFDRRGCADSAVKPAAQASGRDRAVDAARFLAFIGIGLIHTIREAGPPNPDEKAQAMFAVSADQVIDQLGRFAVPFFFVASGFFLARKDFSNLAASVRSIARRIVPVYIVWTAAFTLTDPAARAALGQPGFWVRLAVQGGTAPHLWFLPSLALCMVIVAVGSRILSPRGQFLLAAGFYVLGLAGGAYFQLLFGRSPSVLHLHLLRDVATFGLIFVTTGYWLGRTGWRPTFGAAATLFLLGGALHLTEAWMLVRWNMHALNDNEALVGTLGFGIGAFLMARSWPPSWGVPRAFAVLGTYGLGLYVMHPWIVAALLAGLQPQTLQSRALLAVLTTALSALAVLALARVPRLRWLLA